MLVQVVFCSLLYFTYSQLPVIFAYSLAFFAYFGIYLNFFTFFRLARRTSI
ncbi:unnamed protein product [Meloidogyne enterolobii]|uniref:Uncharacterized protein n=1 Tax=Meloidogyne enterolobii TaxID=390850 RepID=A0ACB1B0Q1_MELEN